MKLLFLSTVAVAAVPLLLIAALYVGAVYVADIVDPLRMH